MRTNRGFTLIEILLVVTIIGILAAAIVPNLVGRDDQARVVAARQDLQQLANALDMYKLDNFRYPSTDQGLQALIECPADAANCQAGGYLGRRKTVPDDPWDGTYVYIGNGDSYELYSLGADGAEGGEGFAADLHLEDI
jgi:general secretion pathway protein G